MRLQERISARRRKRQRNFVLYFLAGGMSPSEFLGRFHSHDGPSLGLRLLCAAINDKDPLDVELALSVSFRFGFTPEHSGPLVELCSADWHRCHEDVVDALGKLHSAGAVDALFRTTQWVPDYLEHDEFRSLARKAIWALGGIPGDEATQALLRLLGSQDRIIEDGAREQLARRDA